MSLQKQLEYNGFVKCTTSLTMRRQSIYLTCTHAQLLHAIPAVRTISLVCLGQVYRNIQDKYSRLWCLFMAQPTSDSQIFVYTLKPLHKMDCDRRLLEKHRERQRIRTLKLYFTRTVVQVQSKTRLTTSPCEATDN